MDAQGSSSVVFVRRKGVTVSNSGGVHVYVKREREKWIKW
jgi:hypothetical protein